MIDLALLFDDVAVHGNPIWQQQQQGYKETTLPPAEGKKILRMVARQNYHMYIHWTHKILSFYYTLPSPFLTHWLGSLNESFTNVTLRLSHHAYQLWFTNIFFISGDKKNLTLTEVLKRWFLFQSLDWSLGTTWESSGPLSAGPTGCSSKLCVFFSSALQPISRLHILL